MFELGLLLPVSTNTTTTTSTSAGELKGARMCNSLVTSGLYSGLLGHRSTSQCGRPQTCNEQSLYQLSSARPSTSFVYFNGFPLYFGVSGAC